MVAGVKSEIQKLRGSYQVTVLPLMLSMKLVKHGINVVPVPLSISVPMELAFQMTLLMKSVSTQLQTVSTVNSTQTNAL